MVGWLLCGDLDLPKKALPAHGGGEFGTQHLDRDAPAVLEIIREEHDRHADLTDLAMDATDPQRPTSGGLPDPWRQRPVLSPETEAGPLKVPRTPPFQKASRPCSRRRWPAGPGPSGST